MDKHELQQIIGENLYRIRTELKLTREQLSEKVGVSTTFYANLENGKKMMSVVTLRRLADILDVPVDSLLYSDYHSCSTNRIQACLRDASEEMTQFAVKLIRFCLEEMPGPDSGARGEIDNDTGAE